MLARSIGSPQQVIEKVHRYHEQSRARGAAPARRRRRAHPSSAPGQPRAVPVRRRPGAAGGDPEPAAGGPDPVHRAASTPSRAGGRPMTFAGTCRCRSSTSPRSPRAPRWRRRCATPSTWPRPPSGGLPAVLAGRAPPQPGCGGGVPAAADPGRRGGDRRSGSGSGAVQTGHRTPLSVVEEFGILDALFPGRIDLGLGRRAVRGRWPPRSRTGNRRSGSSTTC